MKGHTRIVGKTKRVWQGKGKVRIDIDSYLPVGKEEGGKRNKHYKELEEKPLAGLSSLD